MSSSYSVLSYTQDESRGIRTPVGIVLWSDDHEFAGVRVVAPSERSLGLKQADCDVVSFVRDKLVSWIESKSLPYSQEQLSPYEDAWWVHAARLLTHRVTLSEPRAVEALNPNEDLETIYERQINPNSDSFGRESAERINGAVARGLRSLARYFQARKLLPGFKDRPITVTRVYEGEHAVVVVEGVNLCSNPEMNADAAVSRLLRLLAAPSAHYKLMVGYLAPDVINGEAVLVDWLKEQTHAAAFDLTKEADQFFETARAMVEIADGVASFGDAEEE